MTTSTPPIREFHGLTEGEVQQRRHQGQGNDYEPRSSRTIASIVVQNVFAPLNLVLYLIGLTLIGLGRPGDALVTVGTVIFNLTLGLVQEVRVKLQLDQIALLARPKVTVIRDGHERKLDAAELVLGDLMYVEAGDQFVVDCTLINDAQIEVDESQLTGESDAILKEQGAKILSGSFCVSGSAIVEVITVGRDSFANKVAARAREFRVTLTPLQRSINFVIRLLTLVTISFAVMLVISSMIYDIPVVRFAQTAAIIAGIIPSGMFGLIMLNYALGAVRMADKGTLIQQINAVESISSIDVLCTDKTGTLTANRIVLHDVHPLDMDKTLMQDLLGDMVKNVSAVNKTSEAIASALVGSERAVTDEIAFSSARKWSAIAFDDGVMPGAFILGAAEVLAPKLSSKEKPLEMAKEQASKGMRVVLLAHKPDVFSLRGADDEPLLPDDLAVIGLVTFQDELREGVETAIQSFFANGVQVKVISGDSPDTVAALAVQAGFPNNQVLVSGVELAEMPDDAFDKMASQGTIFGRITPEQKEQLVDALKREGHYVAMIGDGVNDVLSLKKADVGIAMYSGTTTTRAVSDIVLLDDSLTALPLLIDEGKRIISGLLTSFQIYQLRSFFIVLTILTVSMMGLGFPYLPKHSSLTAAAAATIPAFLLSLSTTAHSEVSGLLPRIFRFVLPGALVTAIFGLLVYVIAYATVYTGTFDIPFTPEVVAEYQSYAGIDYAIETEDELLTELSTFYAQTALTVFSMGIGAVVVLFAAPPSPFFVSIVELRGDQRVWLVSSAILLILVMVMTFEPLTQFLELVPLNIEAYLVIALACILNGLALRLVWREDWVLLLLGLDADFHAR